jgi:formiminotetrahydrofolate cyclodeaminase
VSIGNTLTSLVKRDAEAYSLVSEAYKLPKEPAEAATRRTEAVTSALLKAAEVPLETARASVEVAQIAVLVAEKGNSNAVTDAGVAALLAQAACRGADYNVRVNVSALEDPSKGATLAVASRQLVEKIAELAATVAARVEASLS